MTTPMQGPERWAATVAWVRQVPEDGLVRVVEYAGHRTAVAELMPSALLVEVRGDFNERITVFSAMELSAWDVEEVNRLLRFHHTGYTLGRHHGFAAGQQHVQEEIARVLGVARAEKVEQIGQNLEALHARVID